MNEDLKLTAIAYHGRKFRSLNNSPNGEVDADTVFHYVQPEEIVWATYQDGSIQWDAPRHELGPFAVFRDRGEWMFANLAVRRQL